MSGYLQVGHACFCKVLHGSENLWWENKYVWSLFLNFKRSPNTFDIDCSISMVIEWSNDMGGEKYTKIVLLCSPNHINVGSRELPRPTLIKLISVVHPIANLWHLGPLHTWDWEPVTITLQALSLVERTEPVQVCFTLNLRDRRSMWMQDGCKSTWMPIWHRTDHASWSLGLFSTTTSWK
jgi:hypothetical protein